MKLCKSVVKICKYGIKVSCGTHDLTLGSAEDQPVSQVDTNVPGAQVKPYCQF